MISVERRVFSISIMLILSFFTLAFLTTNTVEAGTYQGTECPSFRDQKIYYSKTDESCRSQAICPNGESYDGYKCGVGAECPEGYEPKSELVLAAEEVSEIFDDDNSKSKHRGFHFHEKLWCEPVKSCNDGNLNIFGNCQTKPQCPGDMKLNVLGNCQEKSEIESCPEDTKRNAFGNCQATPTCDKGKLNVFGDCESKISISCPSGSTTVAGICEKKASCEKRTKITGICIDYECDSGWKQVVSICTKSPSKSCPSGMKIKGLVCAKSPDCPTGTSLNDIGVCIGKQERSCPSGLTPNAAGYCTKEPTCLKDWTYNEVTNRCEKAPDFPGEGLLDPCPEYSRSGEKEWKDAGYRYGWSEYNSRCVEDEPTCLQYDENSEQDPWEILDDKENARFPGDECILQLCKLPEEHPNWIEKSRCDVQGTSSSPNNLVELPDGSPEIKNPDENKIVQGYSLSGYVFENPDKITPEEINEIYQNDEQFRDWISENSPGTSIENVIEELNESYEILDDSSSEPDIDSTIEPDNNSANKPDTDVLPNTKLDKEIPEWIKDQSEWWVSGAISDREFIDLFEYLIENEIINVPNLPEPEQVGKAPIPSWFKNNVRWWNTGQVTDFDFAKGLEHLVKIGVIVIQKN